MYSSKQPITVRELVVVIVRWKCLVGEWEAIETNAGTEAPMAKASIKSTMKAAAVKSASVKAPSVKPASVKASEVTAASSC